MKNKEDNTLVIELRDGKVENESISIWPGLAEKKSTYIDPNFCLSTIDQHAKQYAKQYTELIINNNNYTISANNKDINGNSKIGYWKLIFHLGTLAVNLNAAYIDLVNGLKENKLWKINVDLSYFIHTTPTEPQFDEDSLILTPTTGDFYGAKNDENLIISGLVICIYTPDYDNYNEIVKIYDFIKEKDLVKFCINNSINYYAYSPKLEKTHILHIPINIENKKQLQLSSLALQQQLCMAIWNPDTNSETLRALVQEMYPLYFNLREELFPTLHTHEELVGKSGANLLHLLMETHEDRIGFIPILVEPKSSESPPPTSGRKIFPVKPIPLESYNITEVMKDALLHKKSMLNSCNDAGYTPAHLAVIHGKAKFLARLMLYPELEHKITKNADTLLHLCAKYNLNVLNILLTIRNGDDKNLLSDLYKQNNEGYTPLHAAIVNKNFIFLNFFMTTPLRNRIDWYNINLCKAGPLPNNQDNLVHLAFRQLSPAPSLATEMVNLYIQIEGFLKPLASVAPHMFDTMTAHKTTPMQLFARVEIPKHFEEESKYKLQQISKTITYIISNAYNFYQTANNNNSSDEIAQHAVNENTKLKKQIAELEAKNKEQAQELLQLKINLNQNKSPGRDPRRNSVSITPGKQLGETPNRLQFFEQPTNNSKGERATLTRKNSEPNSPRDNGTTIPRKQSAPNFRRLMRNKSEGANATNPSTFT